MYIPSYVHVGDTIPYVVVLGKAEASAYLAVDSGSSSAFITVEGKFNLFNIFVNVEGKLNILFTINPISHGRGYI